MDIEEADEAQLWAAASETSGAERARVLHRLGGLLFQREAYEEAAASAETAAGLYAELDQPREEGWARYGAAVSAQRLGRLDDALQAFDRAGDLYRSSSNEQEIADCEAGAAEVLEALGRTEESLSRSRSAIDLFVSSDNHERAASVALDRGELLGTLGRQSEAYEVFLDARRWLRSAGVSLGVAQADDRIAASLIELGQLPEALERLRAVLHVMVATGDAPKIAHARYRLGWTLVLAGEYDEALEHLDAARDEHRELQNTLGVARCSMQGANALSNLGRLDQAIDLYREARAVFDAHGEDADVLIADGNLALAYDTTGRMDEAEALTRRVIVAAGELGDHVLQASVVTRLARILLRQDRVDEASAVLADSTTSQLGRDNLVEGSRFDLARAMVKQRSGQSEDAATLARELVTRLTGSSLLDELAQAYAVLSDAELALGDVENGGRDRAQAIALHLAAGDEVAATGLSLYFLPPQPERETPAIDSVIRLEH